MSSLQSARRILALATLLSTFSACDDKRVKECLSRCASEAEECAHRHGPNCEARGRECSAACEHR
jgi:hypothetical protein